MAFLGEDIPKLGFGLMRLPQVDGHSDVEQTRQMFYTSLENTGAGYFDFYLLHNLGNTRTQVFDDFSLWDFARDLKEQGLIKHLGISLHDKAEVLDGILDAHPEIEFAQL